MENKLNTIKSKNYFETFNEDFYFAHRFNTLSDKDILSNHTHDCFELVLIKNGAFTYHYENFSFNADVNDLIITPPRTYHYYQAKGDKDYERYIIQIKNKELEKYLNSSSVFKVNISKQNTLQTIFSNIDYFCSKHSVLESELFKKTLLLQIETLLISFTLIDGLNVNNKNALSSDTLTKILNYVNSNLSSITTVKDIAEKFFISKNYLFKLFNKHLKITPNRYISQKKMLLAKSLIEKGEKLAYVALSCGYKDYTVFYRNYVKYFSKSPSLEKRK